MSYDIVRVLKETRLCRTAIVRDDGRPVVARIMALPTLDWRTLHRPLEAVEHPGVQTFIRSEVHEGRLWLLSEWVDGCVLDTLKPGAAHLDGRWITSWMAQLLESLEALHGLETPWVVGTLSPSSLVITRQRAVIVDVGLLHHLHPEQAALLESSRWMAPEARSAAHNLPTADVFSVGAIAFWLLTGEQPVVTSAQARTVLKGKLVASRPEMDGPWGAAILDMLSFYPAQRPSSATEARRRLQPWATPHEASLPEAIALVGSIELPAPAAAPLRAAAPSAAPAEASILPQPGVDGHTVAVFYRCLATLYAAGIPLDRALAVSDPGTNALMSRVLKSVQGDVAEGRALSQAMKLHPGVFPPLGVKMIEVGEMTGRMDSVLSRLGDLAEKSQEMRLKVRKALIYPIFLAVLCVLMMVIIPPFVFGGLFSMMVEMGVEMPLLSRIVHAMSLSFQSPWFYAAAAAFGLVGLLAGRAALGRPTVLDAIDGWLLQLPVLGGVLRKVAVVRFVQALELVLNVGVPALQGMQMAVQASGQRTLINAWPRIRASLMDGQTFRGSLAAASFFPDMFLQMVEVGEEAGALGSVASKAARLYEMDLDAALEAFMATIEPLALMVMGVIAGVMVVATLLPMVRLVGQL